MQFDTPVWLGIISYGILAPLGEEIVFRGVVYGQLRKVLKVPYAVVLSGLAFGLFHGNLVQAVYATVIGCLLALVCMNGMERLQRRCCSTALRTCLCM